MNQESVSTGTRPKNIHQRFQRDLIIIIVLVCVITLAIEAFLASGVRKDLSGEFITRTANQTIKEL
jgi:hypothetical protein